MSELSARLLLPYIQPAQAQKHVTHNEALAQLDLAVQLAVEAFGATQPPTQRENGQVWSLGSLPLGEWAGQGNRLAAWVDDNWQFVTPRTGWRAAQGSDLRIWTGTDWRQPDLPALQNIEGLGVGTSYDAANRLAVAAQASLLTHEGAGHQLKINKSSAADTASLLFQTDWSGRAEMGTAGSDGFEIKVSPDGSAWSSGLQLDPATGQAHLPNGVQVTGQITGSAVVQNDADVTAGRVLTTLSGPGQAYRHGNILGNVSQNGGTPSGAILQRGHNSNGSFIRLADGTQICWHMMELGSILANGAGTAINPHRTAPIAWTYPASFSGATVVVSLSPALVVGSLVTRRILTPVYATPTASIVPSVFASRTIPIPDDDNVRMYISAIGRWF